MTNRIYSSGFWLSLSFLVLISGGCTSLYHHQIGEVDSQVVLKGRRFEILLSQMGFSVNEAGAVLKSTTRSAQAQKDIGQAQAILELFQMGPRTGNPVFTDQFADNLVDRILEKCPHGRVSGLSSTRENAKYPVVSGEIVKITGYCFTKG